MTTTTKTSMLQFGVLLVAMTAAGCAGTFGESVTHLARTPRGGVLRVDGPVVPATAEAYSAMTEHCGGRWRVLRRHDGVATRGGLVTVGYDAQVAGVTVTDAPQLDMGRAVVTALDGHEREVEYVCGRGER